MRPSRWKWATRVASPISIGRASCGWAFRNDGHRLHALQRAVENAIAPLGYPTEVRDFTPHLTLGRLARDVRQVDQKKIGDVVQAAAVGSLGRGRSSRWR